MPFSLLFPWMWCILSLSVRIHTVLDALLNKLLSLRRTLELYNFMALSKKSVKVMILSLFYLQKDKSLFDELTVARRPISLKDFNLYVFRELHGEFKNFVTSLSTTTNLFPTLTFIVTSLLKSFFIKVYFNPLKALLLPCSAYTNLAPLNFCCSGSVFLLSWTIIWFL